MRLTLLGIFCFMLGIWLAYNGNWIGAMAMILLGAVDIMES